MCMCIYFIWRLRDMFRGIMIVNNGYYYVLPASAGEGMVGWNVICIVRSLCSGEDVVEGI